MPDRDLTNVQFPMRNSQPKWMSDCESFALVRIRFEQFDVTYPARSIPGPPDAVRIARIDLDPAMILFCVSERELCKGPSRRIEARNLIGMLLAEPNQFAFRIALDGIHPGVLRWRIEERHLRCLVIHLH